MVRKIPKTCSDDFRRKFVKAVEIDKTIIREEDITISRGRGILLEVRSTSKQIICKKQMCKVPFLRIFILLSEIVKPGYQIFFDFKIII